MNSENENKEKKEKKVYEKPTVQKVEFDFREVITASLCGYCEDVSTSNPLLLPDW